MIYFDNAATTHPKPPGVLQAVARALETFGNPSRGTHEYALAASRCIERAREQAAALFGCPNPGRIAFTKNATEALNIAIASIDGHIVTTEAEHNSVLRPVYKHGNYSIVPVTATGRYTLDDLRQHCRPDTRAIVLAHASNLTGNVVPLAPIGRFCRERDILFVVDAAQTAGLLNLDMEGQCIDALCFTGHKALYGLQGTGGLCLGARLTPKPLLVGGSGSHTFDTVMPASLPELLEAGTPNAHGIAALSAGMEYVADHGPSMLLLQANRLANHFATGVRNIAGVRLLGDYAVEDRVPIVTLTIANMDSADIASILAEEHAIAIRAGAHCAPLLHNRFGTKKQGAARFSFSHFNTLKETETALNAIHAISTGL